MIMSKIRMAVGAGAMVVVLGIYWYVTSEISKLESRIAKLETEKNELSLQIAVEKASNYNLKAGIDARNAQIEANGKIVEKAKKEYENWKNKPAEVRYKEVYTYVPSDVNMMDMDECEQLKIVNKAISGLKYEEL
jgi:hypothetical protein